MLNLSPQTIGCRHPTRYNSHAPPLQHPSEWGRQLLVDYCLSSVNGGHLRPEPGVSSLFFDVSSFGTPNRQTSHCAAKPDHRRLAWDHREPWRHWLEALVYCPWRERAKPVEGRVAAAHFGCCVLCCVLWLWQARFSGLTGRKSWDQASQNGWFSRIHNKKIITRCPKCI
jgi:hypothetical protein